MTSFSDPQDEIVTLALSKRDADNLIRLAKMMSATGLLGGAGRIVISAVAVTAGALASVLALGHLLWKGSSNG